MITKKSILESVGGLLPDALMLVGMAGIAYGATQIYAPAGWIVGGGFAFGFGLLLARRGGV